MEKKNLKSKRAKENENLKQRWRNGIKFENF